MKKIAFVISEIRTHEHLSISVLSANLKKHGHATSLIYFANNPFNKPKILNDLQKEDPDFVAFSFMSGMKYHYIDLANYIKQHMDIPIIVGGPAATFDKKMQKPDTPFDAVCIGEGDFAILDFVENYNKNNPSKIENWIINLPNDKQLISGLSPLVEPLDQLPMPDYSIIYDNDAFLKNMKLKMFISGRGCPYKCTYCFNHKFNEMYKSKGPIIRHKSVDYFIEEILQVKKKYPLEGIIFEDDIFIIDKGWLEEFAQKYPAKVGLPYICYIRPNLVNKDIVRLLKLSNCYSVRVAVECGNEELRNKILKRNLSDKQIINACNLLHEADIKIGTINILGLPTETKDNMYETLKLNQTCKPDNVSANIFIPLPGVELTDYAIQKDLLDEDFVTSKTTYHSSQMKYPQEIKNFLSRFQPLFPFYVLNPWLQKLSPLFNLFPVWSLKAFETFYRLFRLRKYYPPVSFDLLNKLKAIYRYSLYIFR
jgi:radical SAM superfamily enzyme YgiQ (UPF0313 family)